MCCMDEANLKEIEERQAGRDGFAAVIDTSLPPMNRAERRKQAAKDRRR